MQFDWIFGPIRLGVKSLRLHKLRSLLTVLGVVFGVCSVIIMLAIGEGIRYEAVQRIKELGASNVIVRSVKPEDGSSDGEASGAVRYGLSSRDLSRIMQSVPTLSSVTAIRDHRRAFTHHDRRTQGRVVGVTPGYQEVANLRLRSGRFISELDTQRITAVAVLGAHVADTLFPLENPLGKSIRIGEDQYYQVIGVIQPRAASSEQNNGLPAEDLNQDVYIPFETDQHRFGETVAFDRASGQLPEKLEIRQITLTVADTRYVKRTAEIVAEILRQERKTEDTIMIVPLDLLEKAEQTQRIFTLVLSAIASISLLIGGIGIMNIMLATVTERTKEIGLRRALGARRQDIIVQFLIETLVLTSVGGLLGVLLGIGLSGQVTHWAGIATMIRYWSPLLAFATSLAVGLIFGLYPARRAAMMDPIEALRHE
jgi:putative ABC transport system permease protein